MSEEVVEAGQGVVANEIPAATVRSGLMEIEARASQILQSMEDMKRPEVPPVLPPENGNETRKSAEEILSGLERFISSLEPSDSDSEYMLPALDEVSQLALVSHSIVAYFNHLRRPNLIRVTAKIIEETHEWLCQLFGFFNSSASYHNDTTESILRALRLACVARCPRYLDNGILAVVNPSLYVSENGSMISLQFACRQLGLSLDCIRMVPCTNGVMDVSVLQKLIVADLANNRIPLMVLADVGASVCGNVDNIARMYDICRTHYVWLHARGHSLAALPAAKVRRLQPFCDSMSLSLGIWLGIPSLPVVLLHRRIENVALSVFESDPIVSRRLSSLSVWTTLQAIGQASIREKLFMAFESCRLMHEVLTKCEGIKILSKVPVVNTGKSIVDLDDKAELNTTLLFDTAISVIVFQFDGNVGQSGENSPDNPEKKIQEKVNQSTDRMNIWLGEILQRDCPGIDLEILDHPTYGTIIRYCPFELGMGSSVPSVEHLQHFADCLNAQVEILKATEHHKQTFTKILENHTVLRMVDLPEWAGLGGVRYVPDGWVEILTDQAKTELNKLNTDLVEQLRATDSAFALGEGPDGMVCVKFGMVTAETDVEELLDLVIQVGQAVQENSRVLDSMSEIVRKGIDQVTADLQRETEEKLWQEGILRHVPVVGRMVNWWSPPPKETGIKGRSLNLTQGVVESTENIYKYHMQIAGGKTHIAGNKSSPPAPIVQQSVGGADSSGHSRNISQSSSASQQQQQQVQQQQQQQQHQQQLSQSAPADSK